MNGIACGIGSLPHTDPQKAVDFILNRFDGIVHLASFPKRTYLENMYVQFTEGLPGRVLEIENKHMHFETEDALDELAEFYEKLMEEDPAAFAMSKDYCSGIYALTDSLQGQKLPIIKGQFTGGLTFALTVSDQNGKLLAYDDNYFDVCLKGCLEKGKWIANKLSPFGDQTILFSDEPGLVGFGSAFFQITEKQVRHALSYTVAGMKETGATAGIHCCANTDWSLIMESGVDILSFDAYYYFEHLVIYADALRRFYNRGGQVAFGIVPNDEKALSVNEDELARLLVEQVDRIAALGIDRDRVAAGTIITPSCGLGSKSEQLAETVLDLTGKTAARFRELMDL